MPRKIKDIKDENKDKPTEIKAPSTPSTTDLANRVKNKANQQKAYLDAQPKVSVLIPFAKGEKKGVTQPFTINGYRLNVPKGVMIQVPQQIAEMIAERFNVELEVKGRSLENKGSDAKSALDV